MRKELSGSLQSYRMSRAVSEDSLTAVLTFPDAVSATFLEDPQSYWSRHFEELFQTAFGQLYLTSKQVRKQIGDLCELEMVRPNTVLLEEDQPASNLVILLSGSLDLRKQLRLPREEGDKSSSSKLIQSLTFKDIEEAVKCAVALGLDAQRSSGCQYSVVASKA